MSIKSTSEEMKKKSIIFQKEKNNHVQVCFTFNFFRSRWRILNRDYARDVIHGDFW